MSTEYKDEMYEEDLQERWKFLGRKKVKINFCYRLDNLSHSLRSYKYHPPPPPPQTGSCIPVPCTSWYLVVNGANSNKFFANHLIKTNRGKEKLQSELVVATFITGEMWGGGGGGIPQKFWSGCVAHFTHFPTKICAILLTLFLNGVLYRHPS